MTVVDRLCFALVLGAALGSGLMAGVFFAFSTFVMRALNRLGAKQGLAAMQAINIAVLNPWFLGVFLGTAGASVGLIALGTVRWGEPNSASLLVGGSLYLVGTFGVTIRFNVPLNNALAGVTEADPNAARRWAEYVGSWTAWNHVRTVAALLALASLAAGLGR